MLKCATENVWSLFWRLYCRYGFIDVLGSGFKYIHCDLVDPIGYLTIVLTIRSNFVYTFSPCLNVWSFIQVLNFGVTFKNLFERGDWNFLWRVGATTVIEKINLFLVYLHFVPTHSIHDFMQKANLELSTMQLVVTRIYGWSPKAFILVVTDKLVYNDAHALSFDLEFYA